MSSKILENEEKEREEEIELQLGDVIQITNPKNEKLDNQIFIIDYIDSTKMLLINTDTLENIKLKISDEKIVGDGTITKIAILSRSDEKGYARQNGLVFGKWIDIHFGGEYPAIITGEITNLENDMIEVKTIDDDILYINFEYKGIPEDLPISMIEIREKPQKPISEKKDLETARTMFDKAAEYWKQAIRLAPNNYIEAQNWLKTTGRMSSDNLY